MKRLSAAEVTLFEWQGAGETDNSQEKRTVEKKH
jgi:hypothetical protein